jgi:hypothetical protein
MKCPTCPVAAGSVCLGESVSRLCELARKRVDYQRQLVRLAGDHRSPSPPASRELNELLERIARCPNRGRILPPSLQAECGCSELSECKAARGRRPGWVSLDECLNCVVG